MKRTPLERVKLGAVVLSAIVSISVLGYVFLFGRGWIDALYMVVITVGTVGFGEHSSIGWPEQLFTMGVIVLGISASVFTLGGFIQMMTEGEIERILASGRASRNIEGLAQHAIIAGFGRVGRILAQELAERKQPFVIVENNPAAAAEAESMGYLAVEGDATEEETLIRAGIQRAKCLVTVLPNDAANVFITLTSRNLNRELQIIARGEQHSTQKKLLQAGANRVVLPASIGAMRIASMITHPSTVELMELVAGRSVLDVEVDELTVPDACPLLGRSIGETEIRARHGLLIVAIKHATGKLTFNPETTATFQPRDIVIVMGRVEDIERFRREYGV